MKADSMGWGSAAPAVRLSETRMGCTTNLTSPGNGPLVGKGIRLCGCWGLLIRERLLVCMSIVLSLAFFPWQDRVALQ